MAAGETTPERHRVVVPAGVEGERIDKFLATHLGDVSRAQIQRAAQAGALLADGASVRVSYRVSAGETLDVTIIRPPDENEPPQPEQIPLDIVYEDEDLIVINKPAGMVVHPAAGNWSGTLVNALLGHGLNRDAAAGAIQRPGIVHRLDKGTSGLLICAKTEASHHQLADQLSHRTLSRVYLAVCWGHFRSERITLDGSIGRSPKDRKKMAVVATGRAARTYVRVMESFQLADLLEITLETGRTHQIRVHLSHAGHPIVGDVLYGGGALRLPGIDPQLRSLGRGMLGSIDRPALHAHRIRFLHPRDRRPLEFAAPPPTDFEALTQLSRRHS